MTAPTTLGALMELVRVANRMRPSVPNLHQLIAPLHDLLEEK